MKKLLILAAIIAGAATGAAQAQPMPPGVSPPVATTYSISNDSLATLLSGGWKITALSGEDGQILILAKDSKWMRCELFDPSNGQFKLSLVKSASSICKQLN